MKHVSRNARRHKVRLFQCTVCGSKQPAVKSLGTTNPGHIKHMWCIGCKAVVPFVQIE